jgi:cytochrome P450
MSTTPATFEGAVFPSADFISDPYPLYRWLRDEKPVYEVPGRGEFLVARHEGVTHVLMHPELFSSDFPRQPEKIGRKRDVLETDPPEHAVEKKLVMTGLKPTRVRGHQARIEAVVDELLDAALAQSNEIAVMHDFAARLPVLVFAHIFDLDPEELWAVHVSGRYIGPSRRYIPEEHRTEDVARTLAVFNYLGEQLRDRVENPRDDLMSEMLVAQQQLRGTVDVDQLHAELDIMFIGGLTTTPFLLMNALHLLMQNPDVLARVRRDRSLVANVLEETFRLESPVQYQTRIATEDTEIDGVVIPKGRRVLAIQGSANRDERVWEHADEFDIDRDNIADHVALGRGIHFCVGAPLARAEAGVAINALLDRAPGNIRLSERNDFEPHASLAHRGFAELYIEIDA